MIKKILLISITTLTLGFSYTTYNRICTKEGLKTQILDNINNDSLFEYNTEATTVSLLYSNKKAKIDDSYLISIEKIYNDKLVKETINNSEYISYNFDADVIFKKDNKSYNRTITSKVIVDKTNNVFEIKSTDDLENELTKEILKIKRDNSEDFSNELNDMSLLYQNEELDIQINYPEYYTYTTATINNTDSTEHNISFYIDDNKISNYVQFLIKPSDNKKSSSYEQELLNKGYEKRENKLKTQEGLEFTIFTQKFTQNMQDITEIIYISNNSFKDINSITITANVNTNILESKEREIEEMIKSVR